MLIDDFSGLNKLCTFLDHDRLVDNGDVCVVCRVSRSLLVINRIRLKDRCEHDIHCIGILGI